MCFIIFFIFREINSGIEKIRDDRQAQTFVLQDLTVKDGHLNRQVESRQEKLAKMQLQHRLAVEALKENITTRDG